MSYNFLDFTREFYPNIWEEFRRYKRKDILPAIGTEVLTLVDGYSGKAGVTRYVVGHEYRSVPYVALASAPNGEVKCLADVNIWWKELKIINEPNVEDTEN